MTKTEQQKRFEAAWHIKWPNDEPRIFEQDTSNYTWPEVQDTFEGFALGEASVLERAAELRHTCDELVAPVGNSVWGEGYQDGWIAAVQAYDEAIRALAQEDV